LQEISTLITLKVNQTNKIKLIPKLEMTDVKDITVPYKMTIYFRYL